MWALLGLERSVMTGSLVRICCTMVVSVVRLGRGCRVRRLVVRIWLAFNRVLTSTVVVTLVAMRR